MTRSIPLRRSLDRSLTALTALAALAAGCALPDPREEQPTTPPAPTPGTKPDVRGGPDPVALLRELQGACSADRWCWERPRPRGVRINAVHATAPNDLWLAGDAGYVLQWNGTSWREHALPDPPFRSAMNMGAIGGRGPSDVWVASGDLLYRWDGASWTLRDTVPPGVDQAFHGIWVAPNGDVWVTMDYGTVRRSIEGGPLESFAVAPAQAPLSELGSIWGVAADDFWIAGRPGRMFHWDGRGFTEHATGTYKSGGDLGGASASDAWIGGYDGTLVHWDGDRWEPIDTGLDTGWYTKGIAVNGADDVRWLVQRGSRDAMILSWDGSALTSTYVPTDVVISDLEIVDGRWWMPGDHGALYVRESATAPIVAAIEPATEPFRAMWGTHDSDMYFAGPGLLMHHDGEQWTRESIADHSSLAAISGLRVVERTEVWAVGSSLAPGGGTRGDILQLGDAGWELSHVDAPLSAVWASGPGEAIAVGAGGAVYWRTGGAWTRLASPTTADLYGVWGPDPDRAWIVGAGGTILRWERAVGTLLAEPSGVTADLRAIHGADGVRWIATSGLGPDQKVAVLQSSPGGWIRHAVTNLLDGAAVFAASATDVRVVGANNAGRVLRWNGAAFVEERTGHTGSLSAVFQPPGSSLWIAGANALLRRAP